MARSNLNYHILRRGGAIILKKLRPYRRMILILTTLGIISAIGNGLIPLLTGLFIDAIIDPTTITTALSGFHLALLLLTIWAIIQLIVSLIDWHISIKQDVLGISVYTDYITTGFAHLLELPLSFHKKKKVGYVAEKINRSANALEGIVGNIIIELGPQFLTIIIALTIAFYLQPLLALWLLVGIVVYAGIMAISVRPLAMMQDKFIKQISLSYGDAFDAIFNAQAIKEATAETRERQKLTRNFDRKSKWAWINLNTIWQNLSFYQRLVVVLVQLAIFLMSLWLITNDQMTIGQLVAFNAYAAMMFGPFVRLGRMWQTLQNGLVNLVATDKILSLPSEKYQPTGAKSLNLSGQVIFNQVDFYYEKNKPVLTDISFTVEAGQTVALVGESGVGKTTLIELISGYNFPRKGKVMIDGNNIKKMDLTNLREQVAVVPQEIVLFNDTIKNNIKYGNLKASPQAVKTATEEAHALEFIKKFPKQWEQLVGERGIKLSTGQKQRVAIARAILRSPKILILDEPTAALDAESESIIQKSLSKLMTGRTTFIIAHRLSTVRHADLILVLAGGQIAERGRHDDLIQRRDGLYRRLYELQVGLRE